MQRLSYDLFSQIVRLKKAMSKRTLFCFNAAFICNVWKTVNFQLFGMQFISKTVTYKLHCYLWHTFTIKALLCKSQYFHTVDSDMQLNNTYSINCCFHWKMAMRMRHSVTLYVSCLCCFLSFYFSSFIFSLCPSLHVISVVLNTFSSLSITPLSNSRMIINCEQDGLLL